MYFDDDWLKKRLSQGENDPLWQGDSWPHGVMRREIAQL
jgi:hypothetical protein